MFFDKDLEARLHDLEEKFQYLDIAKQKINPAFEQRALLNNIIHSEASYVESTSNKPKASFHVQLTKEQWILKAAFKYQKENAKMNQPILYHANDVTRLQYLLIASDPQMVKAKYFDFYQRYKKTIFDYKIDRDSFFMGYLPQKVTLSFITNDDTLNKILDPKTNKPIPEKELNQVFPTTVHGKRIQYLFNDFGLKIKRVYFDSSNDDICIDTNFNGATISNTTRL